MTKTANSPNTRGKSTAASKKKTPEKTVVKKTSARKTKLAAVTEKKRLEERGVRSLKAADVPIVRGSGVMAVAFRKSLSESSAGRKKWDTVTRQAVDHFDGTWDAATVFPYLMRKMGKNARFLCTNGDETSAAAASSSSSSSSASHGSHVWFEMSQEQIISACQIKFNRIAAQNEVESNDGDHDIDMDDDDKKAAARVTPAPGAAGEPTAETKKAASSTTAATDSCATAEEAAVVAPPRQATFLDRVRGLFGWGGQQP